MEKYQRHEPKERHEQSWKQEIATQHKEIRTLQACVHACYKNTVVDRTRKHTGGTDTQLVIFI